MTPAFDHCYTPDDNHRFLARLRRAGFTLAAKAVEHPGGTRCRFLPFAAPRRAARQYLEFVSKPVRFSKPGLSFGCPGGAKKLFKTMRSNRFLRPAFEHRDYDWKTSGQRERQPGWNFIRLRRKFSAAEIWLTEYERAAGKAAPWKPPLHANGCLGIVALHFEVNASGRRYFEALLGKVKGRITLDCGTDLVLERAQRNRFRSVILKSSNFEAFCRRARPEEIIVYDDRPAARFKNPAGSWDLLVV